MLLFTNSNISSELFSDIMNTDSYDRKSCCWNCRRPGHTSKECTDRKRLFCSFCLTPEITTRDCKCRNRRRVQKNRPPPRNLRKPSQAIRTLAYHRLEEQDNASKNIPPPGSIGTMVGGNLFKTFINTQTPYSVAGWKVANQASMIYQTTREYIHRKGELISEQIIPISHGTQLKRIRCKIVTNPDDCISLGVDALLRFGCKLEIGGLTVLNLQGEASIPRQKGRGRAKAVPEISKPRSLTAAGIQNPLNAKPDNPTSQTEIKLKINNISGGVEGKQVNQLVLHKGVNEDNIDTGTNQSIEEDIGDTNTWQDSEFLAALNLGDNEVNAILDENEETRMDTCVPE